MNADQGDANPLPLAIEVKGVRDRSHPAATETGVSIEEYKDSSDGMQNEFEPGCLCPHQAKNKSRNHTNTTIITLSFSCHYSIMAKGKRKKREFWSN
jgi:hypothetical protein